MEINAKIQKILPVQSGISSHTGNEWQSQDIVVDYFWWPNQQYPSQISLRIFGKDRIEQYANLEPNDEVKLRFHIEAHEVNGRWFNEVRLDGLGLIGASAEKAEANATKNEKLQTAENPIQETPPHKKPEDKDEEKEDDIPF